MRNLESGNALPLSLGGFKVITDRTSTYFDFYCEILSKDQWQSESRTILVEVGISAKSCIMDD